MKGTQDMKTSNGKTSKASKTPSGSGVSGERRKTEAKKRLTPKQRKLAADQKFYDDVRQQYSDGELNDWQISKIDERLPGFFLIRPYNEGEAYFLGLLSQASNVIFWDSKDEASDIARIIVECADYKPKKMAKIIRKAA